MSLSSNLLEQAELLAHKERTRPREASLRRSISTAYYAMFHFLADEGTGLLLGTGGRNKALRQLLARAAVHGTMKSACVEVCKKTMSAPVQAVAPQLDPAGMTELISVAEAFVFLQEKRHEADYNLSVVIDKAAALECVAQAKAAMLAWKDLKRLNAQRALFFAVLLFHMSSLSNRR